MLANNETGVVEPVSEIGLIAREHDIPFHCDAVQAVGKRPIDVNSLCTDLLSISSHKLYGPKGIGALYVKEGIRLTPLITGGHHERELRAGTENVAGIVGFAHALECAIDEMDIYSSRISSLRDRFEAALLKRIDCCHNTQYYRQIGCFTAAL